MRSTIGWMAFASLCGLTLAPVRAADDGEREAVEGHTVACESGCAEAASDDPSAALFAAKLTGDWGGLRSRLAQNGISFDADVVQFHQGVAHGGAEQKSVYGAHGDYVLNADVGKLGGMQGGFLKMRVESLFGEAINPATGTVLAANTSMLFPNGEDHVTAITNLSYTQFLSENFAVFGGKLDTLDGDANAFAGGRGKDQFMNTAFVVNPISFRTVPYSALGAGFVILRDKQPLFTFTAINTRDTATTTGFDSLFADGVALAGELRMPTNFFDKPGHQLFALTWSNRGFISLQQDPRLLLRALVQGSTAPLQRRSDSWSFYYNFDQYLYVDPCDSTRGWGLFGRFGISDANPNPLEWFISVGIGGNSPIRCRERDTFGAGYYFAGTSDELNVLRGLNDGQGVELFYNIEVTPSLHITPDLQFLIPARGRFDTAVVAGIRAKIDF